MLTNINIALFLMKLLRSFKMLEIPTPGMTENLSRRWTSDDKLLKYQQYLMNMALIINFTVKMLKKRKYIRNHICLKY